MNVLEHSLREAITVRNIVHGVDDVERVGARDVDVRGGRRLLLQVVGEVEDEVSCQLLRGNLCPAGSLEQDSVVAACRSRRRGTVAVPAVGGRQEILRVLEELKALIGGLLLDGENTVLHKSRVSNVHNIIT